jgi:aspartokinase
MLRSGTVPCVTGFFGAHPSGQSVCTFGRGGSDLTSSTLANCLASQPGRAAVIVWKVECNKAEDGTMESWQDGFTGVVHDAAVDVTIPRLSYREAAQLVAFGKKVLHSETMQPAETRSIPVIVKNTLRPELPGTRICADGSSGGATTDSHPGEAYSTVTSITKATLKSAMDKTADMGLDEAALRRSLGGVAAEDASLLVLVGEDVATHHATRHEAIKALAENSIPTYVPPRVNNSPHSLCIAVPSEQVKAALSALHAGVVLANEAQAARSALHASVVLANGPQAARS